MALDLSCTKALYVHIPFCESICSYCDFCKVLSNSYNRMAYLNSLKEELMQYDYFYFETIYIGGGTPSILTAYELRYLLEILKPYSEHVIEYTIEANPDSLTEDKIQLICEYGINRVSLGVQTFNNDVLKKIHRKHTSKDVIECIHYLHQYHLDDINIDLIYGLPGNDLAQTIRDIDLSDQLDISHLSVYSLILEDHTLLKIEGFEGLSAEEDAYFYQKINLHLRKLKYNHYEVSNYYKVKPSLHNLVYWHYEDYLSVGLGAHMKVFNHQIENTRSMEKYLNHQYLFKDTILSEDEIIFNRLMMGLRLKEGVLLNQDLYNRYKFIIDEYVKTGYMKVEGNRLKLSYDGLLVMDTILLDFL